MDNQQDGRVPDGTGLSQAEPQEGLGPAGFDPSREQRLGRALLSVWHQARCNHEQYSATDSREGDIRFFTLGLTGEAGEVLDAIIEVALVAKASGNVANLVKKRWRDGEGHDQAIRYEVADVLAYAFMLADSMEMTPETLIATVSEKQFAFIRKMIARDSDGSPKGGDACGSVHDSAGPKDIAETQAAPHNG